MHHSSKSTIQGEKVDGPQGKDAQVQDLFHDVRRPDVGEPHDQPLGFGRIRAHEHAHDDEDGHEKDATQDTGQAAPSQNALLLLHHLFRLPLDPELPRTLAGEVHRIQLPGSRVNRASEDVRSPSALHRGHIFCGR
jgi:hypothetical protein